MNERIIEMAKQCGDWNGQTLEMNDVGISKFAELIVKECIDVAFHRGDNVDYFKEHFGVE
jgi:hypothetical protein